MFGDIFWLGVGNKVRRFVVLPLAIFVISGLNDNQAYATNKTYQTAPDQYIIKFKDTVNKKKLLQLVAELSSKNQLKLRHTYKSAIKGFSAKIPADVVALLQTHPEIASIEPNGYWYLDTINAPTNLTIASATPSSIEINWTDASTSEQGVEIARSTNGISGNYSSLEIVVGQNITSYTDNSVAPGLEYCYQVRVGSNYSNVTPYSQPTCGTTPTSPPPATPSGLNSDVIDHQRIDLSWIDNSSNELGFIIERALGAGGVFVEIATLTANVTQFQNSGLLSDTEYCYRIRAYNNNGTSNHSGEICTITDQAPTGVPDSPTGLSLSVINDQRIDLSWVDNANNESGFRIERATGAGATFVEIDVLGANIESYQSTNLASQTEYCYRVLAYNSQGASNYTNELCATTQPSSTGALAAPSNVVAVAPDSTQIDLSWTDNATQEAGFEVQRSTNGINGSYALLEVLAGSDITQYTDHTVTANVEHCYRIRTGETFQVTGPFSSPSCATPQSQSVNTPQQPSALSATAVSSQRINLSWQDNANNESGFRIEIAYNINGPFAEIDIVGSNTSTYNSSGLAIDTQYCYRVQAFNAAGDSAYTTVQCATTLQSPVACIDTGNHDNLSNLYGITITKTHLNPTWLVAKDPSCQITPWFFGIDSGVDPNHTDLNVVEIMGFLAAQPNHSGTDDNGHGTHTAGTAAAKDGNGGVVGVAPGAPIFGFKVCDINGSCALDDITAAVDEVTARKLANPNQPMVANMSLGGGANSITDTAVRRSINAGVTYTISAGNGILGACLLPGNSANNSPARVGDDAINSSNGSNGNNDRINGAITVTSSNNQDQDVNCNYGNPVTVAAPGDSIYSTVQNGGYAVFSGTSMAAPHVAGAVILYLMNFPDATPEEVEQAIVNDLDPWSTNETPNAPGRLNAENL